MDKKEARSRLIQALNLSDSANNTIKNYLRYFDRFIEWVEAETDLLDLNDLTLFHVHDYLALNLSDSANNTIKNYLRYFDRFIEWVEAETDLLDLNDLTLFHVHDYLALIDSLDKYAPKTCNLSVYSIRMFCSSVLDRAVCLFYSNVLQFCSGPGGGQVQVPRQER